MDPMPARWILGKLIKLVPIITLMNIINKLSLRSMINMSHKKYDIDFWEINSVQKNFYWTAWDLQRCTHVPIRLVDTKASVSQGEIRCLYKNYDKKYKDLRNFVVDNDSFVWWVDWWHLWNFLFVFCNTMIEWLNEWRLIFFFRNETLI